MSLFATKKRSSESGFAIVWVLGLFVVAVIGFIGWKLYYYKYHRSIITLAANCQAPELNLSIGPSSGTAGTAYVDAVFTNQGLRTCILNGYPMVALVDAHNAMLGAPAMHNTAFPASTITLHPGESAHAAMGFPDPGNFAAGLCTANSATLKATPPSLLGALETPLARQYCPGFSVTVVQSGR